MGSVNVQMELIQLLIDRVQHQHGGVEENKASYDKLLTLSEQFDYTYGQALAHTCLARYFRVIREDRNYYFHLKKARRIAENKNYFDVLMTCCRLEGLRNATECNETTALALYLKGTKMALEIKDKMASAGFFQDIGDLFYGTDAFEDAERFYQKALSLLEGISIPDARFRQKAVLVGLVHLACIQGYVEKARNYLARHMEINVESPGLRFFQQEGDAFIHLLDGNYDQARKSVSRLLEELRRGEYCNLPESAYVILMQLLLALKDQTGAAWCIERLDDLCKNAGQDLILRGQELRLQYAEVFDLVNDGQYRLFYEVTANRELSRGQATGESFKNLIALYETEKQRDRTQLEQSELEMLVNTDELTQIYNRRYLGKLMSKFTQDERVSTLGYVMIDVDYFKEYNDCFGHPQGDVALSTVATLLAKHLPENAYAVRYGGDEFVCLFVDRSDAEIVAFVEAVQVMLQEMAIPHSGGSSKTLTLSFGIYNQAYPLGSNEATLAERADEALYRAKEQGRNTYAIYTPREDM